LISGTSVLQRWTILEGQAKEVLGWEPKVNFKQLVAMMVEGDLERAKREKVLVDNGYIDSHQQP
jgi:GDPmannose 4,6-dehydratase